MKRSSVIYPLKMLCRAFLLINCSTAISEEMDDFFSMSPEELANISVTLASGTAKPIYQSAAVTSVITAQQIRSMGATSLSQVLDTVPGMHVSIQAVTNDPVYSMRGIRNDINNQVLVMMNGTRFSVPYKGSSMTGMELPVEAIQRVEVIRGPGSALYGADAFAGVINIVTKKAKDIDGTEIGVRGGSWDTQSGWGMHGDEWLGWNVATTLQYSHNNNDEDRTIHSDLQSQLDSALGTNASLTSGEMETQAETWNAHLNLERKHWDINFWAFNESDGGLRAGAGGSLDDEGSLDGENYLADVSFSSEDSVENWELTVDASYLYSDIDARIHNFPDNSVLPINENGMITPTAASFTYFPDGALTYVDLENQVASFEIGAVYQGIDKHLLRLSSGYRYEQVEAKEKRNFGIGILDGTQRVVDGTMTNVTGTDLIFLPDSDRSIWSVALQDEWQIAPDWLLTTGIRYDEYSDFGSTFNPRVALVWTVNEQFTSKLLYGQAFRAPSFLEQKQQNSQLFIGDPDLDPETIETVELAFDYRPYSNLRLASNFYYYEIDDQIGISGDGVARASNNAGQTGYGTEFEWDWSFHEQWNLKGNYAWQYSRNDETNSRVIGVPEHQLYVAASWEFLPQWQLQTQLNWVGHRIALSGINDNLDDYETVDITLNSKRFFGYVDFTASVHNVFDSNGKEPATDSYRDNLPIASRSFYFQTTIHF